MIINDHKLIFIHIPKCGGSSMVKILEKYYVERFNRKIGHSTYLDYKNRIGDEISNYKSFTVVRNPWDWHVSQFFYLKSISPKKHGHYIEHSLFNKKGFNFNDYIYWLIDENKEKSPQEFILKNQYEWCINEKGYFMIDHTLKMENYKEDYHNFCKIYNIKENKIPHINKSNHNSYKKYYTTETKKIIENKHKLDIEFFKYKF
jgi:hypothetical protein